MTFKKSYSTFYTQRTLFTASVRSSFYKKKWKHSGAIVDIVAIVFVIDNNINKMTTIIYFLHSGLSVYLYLK